MLLGDIARGSLWSAAYFAKVRPRIARALRGVERRAKAIEDPTLRELALSSLERKRFHCEGGAVLTRAEPRLIRFVAAYQTLCDYLDTLTDRGPRVPRATVRRVHRALLDAVDDLSTPRGGYFATHPCDDGGYAAWLVDESRAALAALPGRAAVRERVRWLAERYVDLQVGKHDPIVERRADNLRRGFLQYGAEDSRIGWWEYAAATGSTLGIFALLREALSERPDPGRVKDLFGCYFPWMSGLHILLDYFIDQAEDAQGGDFNFIRCYPDETSVVPGLQRLFREADRAAEVLADADFHRYVARGLLGFYLSDRKVDGALQPKARQLLIAGGPVSRAVTALSRFGRSP